MTEQQTDTVAQPTQEEIDAASEVIEAAKAFGLVGCDHLGPCPSGKETPAELEHFPPLAREYGAPIFSHHTREAWAESPPGDHSRAELMSAILMAASNLAGAEYDAAWNDHLRSVYGFVADRARNLADDLREAIVPVNRILEQRLGNGWTIEELTGMRDRNIENGWADHSKPYRAAAAERWDEYAERARENARRLREEPESAEPESAEPEPVTV